VALLHSFQYDKPASLPTKSRPWMRPAPWRNGAAWRLSHYPDGLWDNGKYRHGPARAQTGAGNRRRQNRPRPPVKKRISALVAAYYAKDGNDTAAHSRAFEQKMRKVQAAYPDEVRGRYLHALTLVHHSAQDGPRPLRNQRRCGEIARTDFQETASSSRRSRTTESSIVYDNLIDLLPFVLVPMHEPSVLQDFPGTPWRDCRMNGVGRILTGWICLKETPNIVIDTVWLTEARSLFAEMATVSVGLRDCT